MRTSVNKVPNGFNTVTGAQMVARYNQTAKYKDAIKVNNLADIRELSKLGIYVTKDALYGMKSFNDRLAFDAEIDREYGLANDAALPTPFSTTNAGIPIQYLQTIIPGWVGTIYPARKIDEVLGVTNIGRWEDEIVAQGTVDYAGIGKPYMDHPNTPLANVNVGFNEATVQRFELGLEILRLEDARTSAIGMNLADHKRRAVTIGLDTIRNMIGFRGYNDGASGTYGMLNAPDQPAYITVPNGAAGTSQFATKTTLEIIHDYQMTVRQLRLQTGDNIDFRNAQLTFAIASDSVDFLSTPTELGYSFTEWLSQNYPNVRIVSVPELTGANGGQNVAYLFIDADPLDSSDDGRTFLHINPARMVLMGVEPEIKGYGEGYTNATAGVLAKRPTFIVRLSGV